MFVYHILDLRGAVYIGNIVTYVCLLVNFFYVSFSTAFIDEEVPNGDTLVREKGCVEKSLAHYMTR
jgi:hypothetical protein